MTRDERRETKDRLVQTILFDFDGTLVFHQPDSFDIIRAFCAEIGQPLEAEAERRGRRTRHEYFVSPTIVEQIRGLSADEFWWHFNRHLLAALGIQGDLDRLTDELMARFAGVEMVYYCPPAGCHTLAELRVRGYRLGLISNRDRVERLHELLEQMELWPYFDLVLASGEVGVRKPDPGIFYAALERLGAKAGQSAYVGDNYWADVIGARNAGLIPVLLDPYRLFPEADCLTLEQIEELLEWLP